MSGINDDYDASWDTLDRAWKALREQDPSNEWLQFYNGNELQQHVLADRLWDRETFVETEYGLLRLLFLYQRRLEKELRQTKVSQTSP